MSVLSLSSDAAMFLAEEPARGPEFGKASPIGLLIILLLLIAVFLLIRSMNKQLKRLPESFDSDHPQADQAFDEGTDRVDGDAPDSENGTSDGGQQHGGSPERG